MPTAVGRGARAAGRARQVASHEARRLLADLMALDPDTRRSFMRGLTEDEWRELCLVAQQETGSPFGLWVDDPVGFVQQVLGESIWSKARELLAAVPAHERVAVPSCYSSSKCVPYNETMQLADGSLAHAGDLVGREFHVLGWQEDGTQTVRRARAQWNTTEPVYRLVTESGRVVTRNGHHPLWVAHADRLARPGAIRSATTGTIPRVRGWVGMADLDPANDLVLVPEHVHAVGDLRLPSEEAALLGYLLGDGGTTTGIQFSQMAGPALDEFIACAEKIGGRVVEQHSKGRHREVAVRGREILTLARGWGILGCRATEKRLAPHLWRCAPDTLAVIAGRLFSCDGYVHIRQQDRGEGRPLRNEAYAGLTLTNEGLVRDFQRMMLRLGVCGSVRPIKGDWQGKRFTAWQWTTTRAEDLKRMADVLDAPAKNGRLRMAAEVAAARRKERHWLHRNAPEGYRWERIKSLDVQPPTQTVAIEVDVDHTWVDQVVEHNTWAVSRLVLWHTNVHPVGTALAVTIAPLWRQVLRQVWPELRKAHRKSGLPGRVDQAQLKLEQANGLEWTAAYGLPANPYSESAVQGIHAPHLLLVVDEAGGIGHVIGRNLNALLTGGAHMVAIGNPPTDDEGSWFEQLCEGNDSEDVEVIRIDADSTPNFSDERAPRCRTCPPVVPAHSLAKHLVDRRWVDRMTRAYGDDSPFIQAKVHARFPRGGARRILPHSWLDAAKRSDEPELLPGWRRLSTIEGETSDYLVQDGAWVRLGVDVAADGGDELAVARSVGNLVDLVHTSAGQVNENSVDVAGVVLQHIRQAERVRTALGTAAKVRVKVDVIGLGWGVVSTLEAWRAEGIHDAEIVPTDVREGTYKVPDPGAIFRPRRKRDEMWVAVRSLLQPQGPGLPGVLRLRVEDRTVAQLSGPMYGTSSAGETIIESKESLRRRGLASPDRAEACLLTLYEPTIKPKTGTGVRLIA